MDWVTALFLVAGVLLIASEAVHAAMIPIFFGVAALIVAGARGIGLVESVPMSLLMWSITSVALTLPLRPLAKRLVAGGVRKYDRSDEVKDALGQVVEVIESVDDVSNNGRIRFQGTTWAARSTEGIIPAGTSAKLYFKDKLVWVIEPLNMLDDVGRVPTLEEQMQAEEAAAKVRKS